MHHIVEHLSFSIIRHLGGGQTYQNFDKQWKLSKYTHVPYLLTNRKNNMGKKRQLLVSAWFKQEEIIFLVLFFKLKKYSLTAQQ